MQIKLLKLLLYRKNKNKFKKINKKEVDFLHFEVKNFPPSSKINLYSKIKELIVISPFFYYLLINSSTSYNQISLMVNPINFIFLI